MLAEFLQDRAALYVSGAMTAAERENFELLLEFHDELCAHVAELQDVAAALVMARVPVTDPAPPAGLKVRLLASLDHLPPEPPTEPDGMVVTDPAGLVEWVNPAFTALCGYPLEEIRGKKPGQFLQGPETDPAPVQRLREALREGRPCCETLVNYRKDGSLYCVSVAITPILDDEGRPRYFFAKERKVPDER